MMNNGSSPKERAKKNRVEIDPVFPGFVNPL